jgi:hypothetical protein
MKLFNFLTVTVNASIIPSKSLRLFTQVDLDFLNKGSLKSKQRKPVKRLSSEKPTRNVHQLRRAKTDIDGQVIMAQQVT